MQFNFLGTFDDDEIPIQVKYLLNHDFNDLLPLLNKSNINKEIKMGKYINERLINIAIIQNDVIALDFLIENGASVKALKHEWMTPISYCARFFDLENCLKLIQLGALDNLSIKQKKRIYYDLFLQSDKSIIYDLINLFNENDLSLVEYGGDLLIDATYDNKKDDIIKLLDLGIDVNYHEKDVVFTDESSALLIATMTNNLDLVKLLVSRGADITYKNLLGHCALTLAKEKNFIDIYNYLLKFVSADFLEFISEEYIIKKFKLDPYMINFLHSDNLKLNLNLKDIDCKYIEFYKLKDTLEIKIKKRTYLSILKTIDNYDIYFLYYKKNKCVYAYDFEHETFKLLGSFKDLINNIDIMVLKALG